MANLKISLRKKGTSSFEGGDKLLPETDWGFILNKPATFVPDPHGHTIGEIIGLQDALDGITTPNHTHSISQVTGLQDALDGKSDSGHTHTWGQITSKPSWIGSVKPSYNLDEISNGTIYEKVSQSDRNNWDGKQDALGYTPENTSNKRTSIRASGANNTSYVSELGVKTYVDNIVETKQDALGFTPENTANKRNSIRTSGANHVSYISELGAKEYVDMIAETKQDALGFTPVPTTRTIAGLSLSANRSRDAIIGVSANGYLRRTDANTYDVRTVANLKSDLGIDLLGALAYESGLDLSQIAETTTYKRVSQSEKNAWNAKADITDIDSKIGDYDDYIMPVINGRLKTSLKGSANGLAELDAGGKVPASQLPSFVDDVLEFTSLSTFPTTGESGKIYIDLTTNKTYRWGGTGYVVISETISLGETSSTAYRGDLGKIAYDHSQLPHAPSNAQKNSDITKAEIEAKLTGPITSHTHAYLADNHPASGVTVGKINNWDSAYSDTNNATHVGTPNRIVKRDANGNFAAGTITANLAGTASGNLTSESTLNPAKVSQSSSYRFVTDSEKNTWNNKQDQVQVEAIIANYDSQMVSPALAKRVTYKGLLGTTDLNTLNTEAAQGIYSQNSNANATTARNYPTASSGAGLLRVYWTGANNGVVQEYNNYIDGRIYVRAYQGSSWSGWSTIADRGWVTSNTRSNTWVPSWSQVTSKPSWIGSSKPSYNLGEIAETTTYKRVTQTDKDNWNLKVDAAYVEGQISDYDDYITPVINQRLKASAKGETANKTLSFGSTFKVLQTLSNGNVNERTITMPSEAVPTYTLLGSRSSTGSQIITNASEYEMFYIEFFVHAHSLNGLEFTRGFFTNNQGKAVGVNFFDHNNIANVFLNAYMTATQLYVHDQGEMPFNMITGTKGFNISVYGVKFE